MKYYETGFDEYVQAVQICNLHPELKPQINELPNELSKFQNAILYGPPGSGKYSQALSIIHKYSPSSLKYDKKIAIINEKSEKKTREPKIDKKKNSSSVSKRNDFVYRISDVHYEVDMSLLGCNSKTLWHEIFFQIVDIVSVKPEKHGIILCKNMHSIYNELLDVFYSYINHPLHYYNIQLRFILLTESISFLPQSITNSFNIMYVKLPDKDLYLQYMKKQNCNIFGTKMSSIITNKEMDCIQSNLDHFGNESLYNLKEVHILKRSTNDHEIPKDVFNIIVDDIIFKMLQADKLKFQEFRNNLYDMLIYNLDVSQCICHIIFYMIEYNFLKEEDMTDILSETYTFFKYYNNNYRPIYHLENILFFIINKIHFKKE